MDNNEELDLSAQLSAQLIDSCNQIINMVNNQSDQLTQSDDQYNQLKIDFQLLTTHAGIIDNQRIQCMQKMQEVYSTYQKMGG
jgi:hypothetical protein